MTKKTLIRDPSAASEPVAEIAAAGDPDATILSIQDLFVGYNGNAILHIPALKLQQGDVLAVMGRSGCGKTTLLSCLSGQIPPLAGTFVLAGARNGEGLRSTFVSRTHQGFPLLHWRTVRDNLALAARIRGVRDCDFDQLLASFSAQQLADRYPASLSGGERCRASLSQATLGDPKLLLLDEPFTGLDTNVKQLIARNLFRLAREAGAGIIFVTHDLHDAVDFSDRVAVIGGTPGTIVHQIDTRLSDAPERLRTLLAGMQ